MDLPWPIALQLPLVVPVVAASPTHRHESTGLENLGLVPTTSRPGLEIPNIYFRNLPVPSTFPHRQFFSKMLEV